MSDEELIEQTLTGNQDAFAELVTRYQDRLYNVVYHIVNDREEACDIVQETFLQSYTNLSRFRQSSRFYTWLYRIAFNISIGTLRQKKRKVSMEQILDDYGECLASKDESPEHKMTSEESSRLLWEAINRLPSEYRTPLILREMEEASYEEIADILHVPVGTVRSRLHRARLALKDLIERRRKDL